MSEIRLLFGRPAIQDRRELIAALQSLRSSHDCIAQALDADKVVSEKHIAFAVEKALAAFALGRNIAKDPGVEILRYASGERQIERALNMGISDNTKRLALVLIQQSRGQWPGPRELAGIVEQDGKGCSFEIKAVKETFNISDEEIEAVGIDRMEDLVIERVALVDTYR
jgi:KEOPS complex subunit Cgi121